MSAKSIRDLSIAGFFLTISVCLIAGAMSIKPLVSNLAEMNNKRNEARLETFALVKNTVNAVITEYQESSKLERTKIEQLTNRAEKSAAFLEEISVIAGARFLEDSNALPPATADEMVRQAIQTIKTNHSERIGKLLDAVNDTFLRKR